jgi:serine/threonine-protein kinase HipA
LLLREAKRLRDGVHKHAPALVDSGPYDDAERAFVGGIAGFAIAQAERLCDSAKEATTISADLL